MYSQSVKVSNVQLVLPMRFYFFLILACIGLCRCHEVAPSALFRQFDMISLQGNHVRNVRQDTCGECSFNEVLNISLRAGCAIEGFTQSIIDASRQCGLRGDPQMARRCAQKENGEFCALIEISQTVNNARTVCMNVLQSEISCSSECKSALQSVRDKYGCCLNINLNRSQPIFSYSLWTLCGVEPVDTVCSNIATITPVDRTQCSAAEHTRQILNVLCSTDMSRTYFDTLNSEACTRPVVRVMVNFTCTQDAAGQWCLIKVAQARELSVMGFKICREANGTCSSTCRELLEAAKDGLGCCINNALNTPALISSRSSSCISFLEENSDLWERCGISSPGFCASTLTATASMATAVNFLVVAAVALALVVL